jgi:hypothetical protein
MPIKHIVLLKVTGFFLFAASGNFVPVRLPVFQGG